MLTFPFDKPVPIVSQYELFHFDILLQSLPSAVSKEPPAYSKLLEESFNKVKTALSKPLPTGCHI